jgi:sulfide:quinone oxidoreductase
MGKIVILGAGTAGTMMANKLRRELDREEWDITIIDKDDTHVYQPGLLFVPFGEYKPEEIVKPRSQFIPRGVNFVIDEITKIDPDNNTVHTKNGSFSYDWLIVGLGCRIVPEEVEGMMEGWHKNIFDFYTLEGAVKLREALASFEEGRLVLNIAEMPIKCPVAPIEFVFLADWYFYQRGIRDQVEIELVTPLPGAFTKPIATKVFTRIAEEKGIIITPDFNIGEVNAEEKYIESFDGKKVNYDLLVAIPPNFGPQVIEDSGMGDMGYIDTDKHTLKAKRWDNVYVLGDVTNVPTSKAGSVTHFESDIVFENLMAEIKGRKPHARFDGHSNCFIESGFGRALLIDFNYDTEPLPGKYPLPVIGPFDLLGDTETNHWGKLLFKWVYWNVLLPAGEMPMGPEMYMYGKHVPKMAHHK